MTIFVVLLWQREKKDDASGRKALRAACVCVWVDVWPLSLASPPAPHGTLAETERGPR